METVGDGRRLGDTQEGRGPACGPPTVYLLIHRGKGPFPRSRPLLLSAWELGGGTHGSRPANVARRAQPGELGGDHPWEASEACTTSR